MCSESTSKLAVIDFTNEDLKPGSSTWSSACMEIRRALENHGCFIALYDQISPQLHEAIFRAAEELFELPSEIKARNVNDLPFYGHVQIPGLPLLESLGIDYANTVDGVQSFTHLLWPNGQNSFFETAFSFAKIVTELEKMVIKMLFESYGVEKISKTHIESSKYILKFLKYRAPQMNETVLAFPPHTDVSFLSILHQNHISGLEIRSRDGEWFHVKFPPNSFLVMAGNACKAWSNDRILAPCHKVTMDANRKEARYTTALFSYQSKMVEIPQELIDEKHPLQFRPFLHADLVKFYAIGMNSQRELKEFCGV